MTVQKDNQMHFSKEEARKIGDGLGINWSEIDFEQFRMGLEVELEHGIADPRTNVTNNDPILTGKIAWAHLNELPDYYSRLKKLEEERA
jgi:uncharacterized protein DUF5661